MDSPWFRKICMDCICISSHFYYNSESPTGPISQMELDGLAAGTSAIIVITLGIFAWVSGNIIFAQITLNVMYIPRVGRDGQFISLAFAGALIGFLWYNTYPAQVFYGRYRKPNHRRDYRRDCDSGSKGVVDPCVVWNFLSRKFIGGIASGLL